MVVEKIIPFEMILRDATVCELYILDKLQRQASHGLFRAVIWQLEGLIPGALSRSFLPPSWHIEPLTNRDEKRFRLPSGAIAIANTATKEFIRLVLPHDFDLHSVLLCGHVLDRGSTGCAVVHWAQHCKLLWTWTWGYFHDTWNAIKTACKMSNQGRWWVQVLRLASIVNLNHGPFRSGAWSKVKQQAHFWFMSCHTIDSLDFREAAARTSELLNKPIDEADYLAWWQYCGSLPSCTEAGPLLKFARWMSIQECWTYLRKELWFLKLVLKEMHPESALAQVQQSATAMLDAELSERLTSSTTGLLAKAPGYITWNLIDTMDMFNLATSVARATYQVRTTQIKSPQQGLTQALFLVRGGWENQHLNLINTCFRQAIPLCGFGADDPARLAKNCKEITSFVLELMGQQLIRELPQLLQLPQSSVTILDPDVAHGTSARNGFLHQARMFFEQEHLALTADADLALVLSDISWRQNCVVRLLFNVLDKEGPSDNVSSDVRHIAESMHHKLPDEKAPEDIHQFVRDRGRAQRHKNMKLRSVHDAAIQSGVLEARGVRCPHVAKASVAQEAWRSIKFKEAMKRSYIGKPRQWCDHLNGILNPANDYASPTVPGQFQSMLAWQWLLHRADNETAAHLGSADAWWSRLVPHHAVLLNPNLSIHCVCLIAGRWGCVVADLSPGSEGTWQWKVEHNTLHVIHICEHQGWVVVPVEGVAWEDFGIGLSISGMVHSLLECSLRIRRSFSKWELLKASAAVFEKNIQDLAQHTATDLLHTIIDFVFKDTPDMISEIKQMYASEKPQEEEVIDKETADLIEEMAITDQVNSGDLNAWRGDIQKQTVNKLSRLRKQAAKEKLEKQKAAKEKLKKHKAAKQLVSQGKFAKRAALTGGACSAAPATLAVALPVEPSASAAASSASEAVPATALAEKVPDAASSSADVAVASTMNAPKSGGGWTVLTVPGGWLRFNDTMHKLDAHCNRHGPKCKMDGSLAKGNIGHCLAWLTAPGTSKELHDKQKFPLSEASALETRRDARNIFMHLAALQGGLYQEVLDAEHKLRMSNDEPVSVSGYYQRL